MMWSRGAARLVLTGVIAVTAAACPGRVFSRTPVPVPATAPQALFQGVTPPFLSVQEQKRRGYGHTVSEDDFSISLHIIGGDSAEENQFPEIVSLQYNKTHFCGGTLIDEEWVLTAAHCVNGVDLDWLSVVGGTLTWANGGVRIQAEAYQVHDEYNPIDYLTHDVALVKLASAMPLSTEIQLCTLRQAPVSDGDATVVVGWGMKASANNSKTSDTLQFVDVTVLESTKCQEVFDDYATVYDNQICTASFPGKGECKGDSGGPLFEDGMQVGIVSWSPKPCATTPYPSVYASVSAHLSWIRKNSVPYV